jgi:excisionase family DNA binding protein
MIVIDLSIQSPQAVQVWGYWWALCHGAGDYRQYYVAAAGDPARLVDFEVGIMDAHRLDLIQVITVSQAAVLFGCSARYVREEIVRGNLRATRVGSQYQIARLDFEAWLATPRRGSRLKAKENEK